VLQDQVVNAAGERVERLGTDTVAAVAVGC
jgi:hypothetical protein